MKSLRQLLSYRKSWALGLGLLGCTLPLLHPYSRQSLFGPQIDGIPVCVWEDEIYRNVHPQRSWFWERLARFRVDRQQDWAVDVNSRAALPLYERLAEEGDAAVRQYSLKQLKSMMEDRNQFLRIVERHLDDSDPACRLLAIDHLWKAKKDPRAIAAALTLRDHPSDDSRLQAFRLLERMSAYDASLGESLAAACDDRNPEIRQCVMRALVNFPELATDALRKGLRDQDQWVRYHAVKSASTPALLNDVLAVSTDPDRTIRRNAAFAAHRIDPQRFPEVPNWGE